MLITSRQNENVKRAASLKQKKNRDVFCEYLVEGEKLVSEAFKTGQIVRAVFATDKYLPLAASLIEKACAGSEKAGVQLFNITQNVLESIADEITPQGIAAVVKINKNPPICRLTHTLLLDRLQDPGNVGAILRLAAAAGITDVFLISCADPYSPKAVRSSMSGLFRLNVHFTGEQNAASFFKQNGIELICADMNGENVFSFNPPEKFCLCVGNEGNGISDFLKESADKTVRVPMQNGVESLNVGIAAGITLYTLINNLNDFKGE